MQLPPEFTQRMSVLLPDEYTDFLASYNADPLTGVRANTLKLTPQRLRTLLPGLTPTAWCETGFTYTGAARPGKSPYYHAGLFYIQEPSAMSPAAVMDVTPGHRVLDMCAAPGGKSTQLAAKLAGSGVLVANDISATRARALVKNIELCGAVNCVVTAEPPARLAPRFEGYFDRILVDAPCSGEGMFRRDPDARAAWSANKPSACRVLQRESLYHAARMLRPGGRLMYSTCTFAPEENELMISEFLAQHACFSGVDITAHGLSPGLYGEPYTARIWPHRHNGEGHFLAYLQKSDTAHAIEPTVTAYPTSRTEPAEYTDFCDRYLTAKPARIAQHVRSLYMPPAEALPNLQGLRLLRCGLYLGDVLTKRFEPAQAFAMAHTGIKQHVHLNSTDARLLRYLKGESIEADCADGWNVITLEGWPLGWAKAADGRLKNKYAKGWLMK